MRFFANLDIMMHADIRSLIAASADRVTAARAAVREIEDEIARQRGRLCSLENREAAARRARDRAQDDVELWRAREVEADQALDERERKRASQKRESLEVQLRRHEAAWWEATAAAEELRRILARLEDQAQEARRQKESALTVERRERSSSDFIPLPPNAGSHSVLCQPPVSEEIEDEMERLRRDLEKEQ